MRRLVPNGHALQRPLCAAGELGAAVNVRTLTTHIGFVRMAVTAPKWRAGGKKGKKVGQTGDSRGRVEGCELASAE